jgi:putative tryptophan/tyrosine transport system substrate-binding protein
MTSRRRFLAVATYPLFLSRPVVAQQPRVHRVGILRPTAAGGDEAMTPGIQRALRNLGYAEGRNMVIDVRFADNKLNRLPALAQELVASKVDVIIAVGAAAVRAAKAASATVPIVFFGNFDPVKGGFVASLAQPGGNMTGILIAPDGTLAAKKVELLAQTVPGAKRMALLLPDDPNVAREQVPEVRKAAAGLGIDLFLVEVREGNYRAAFDKIEQVHGQLLFVASTTFFVRDRRQIIELANRYKLPAMYEWPDQVDDGGLIAFGPSRTAIYARIAEYVDRILKGAKAGDLPVEQPSKLELVINLKTAKSIGLTIPQALLLRADRLVD